MRIGVPKEIKPQERRVGLVPRAVVELIGRGHQVVVQSGAGAGVGASDAAYRNAGADVVETPELVFERADLIVKVKEPQPSEVALLNDRHVLFTYLHLAAAGGLTDGLADSGCTAIAYETVVDESGGLPLLAPMSEIAGRMSVQVGAACLQREDSIGVLLGGAPGVEPARVTILGGGVSGVHAARMAVGLGAEVTIIEKNPARIRQLEDRFETRAKIVYSTDETIGRYVTASDLVIGAVLIPGAAAPNLVTRDLVRAMGSGTALVDIAVDQGGCCETTHPTTHNDPTFLCEDVIHYCVANMPGAVPRTSAYALNNAILPYVLAIAEKGWRAALLETPGLLSGLNICRGAVTHFEVARDLGRDFTDPRERIAA